MDLNFIIKSFAAAWFGTLKESIITLSVKKSFFIKSSLLKTVVYISSKNKIILIFYQFQQIFINRSGCILIAVDINIAAPICPVLIQGLKRIKAAGVHIGKAIFSNKIGKVSGKSLPGIRQSGRGRKTCTCPDDNGVCLFQFFF